MSFITGVINDANPGPALYTVIEARMISDGWTLVDTVTIGGNTHKILKSAAAGNARNLDWYLDINFPTTGLTGGIRFAPFENYNAATDQATRGPIGGVSDSTFETTFYSRAGATTDTLEGSQWTNKAANTRLSLALAGTSFTYYLSLTRNHIKALITPDPGKIAYSGFFTPTTQHIAAAGSALFPLVMTTANGGDAVAASSAGNVGIALTRIPKMSVVPNAGWSSYVGSSPIWSLTGGIVGQQTSQATNEIVIVPLPVFMGGQLTYIVPPGSFVGILEGLAIGQVAGTVTRGDTIVVGTETWYVSSSGVFMRAE